MLVYIINVTLLQLALLALSFLSLVTDSGLVIPCISSKKHKEISNYAADMGISMSRQLETFGLGASQMALSLLGGNNRCIMLEKSSIRNEHFTRETGIPSNILGF